MPLPAPDRSHALDVHVSDASTGGGRTGSASGASGFCMALRGGRSRAVQAEGYDMQVGANWPLTSAHKRAASLQRRLKIVRQALKRGVPHMHAAGTAWWGEQRPRLIAQRVPAARCPPLVHPGTKFQQLVNSTPAKLLQQAQPLQQKTNQHDYPKQAQVLQNRIFSPIGLPISKTGSESS